MSNQVQELLPFLSRPAMPHLRVSATNAGGSRTKSSAKLAYYEFFAGGGMVRCGLGPQWKCLFANDFDFKKCTTYRDNWGDRELVTKDIAKIDVTELPGTPSLVWASFPCQDLSLAGMGAGLRGDRSGTFWPFWDLMLRMKAQGRNPRVIVLENVCGTLTSHHGKDFIAIAEALSTSNYLFGAVVIDAVAFVPQSRPRLFIVAVDKGSQIPDGLILNSPTLPWHTKSLRTAHERLSEKVRRSWVWWTLPNPDKRTLRFVDLMEKSPSSVAWHTPEETARILSMMSSVNAAKVAEAKKAGKRLIGTIYKRTRFNSAGQKVQRAEVRFDGIAGCLRTPAGGSSRQVVIFVNGSRIQSRLLSGRETARLMGLPDEYRLPANYNEAYHLTGDGVAAPSVRFLAEHLLEPLIAPKLKRDRIAL